MLRLASTDEPPAEEAHEAPDNDDRGDGDARDRAGRKGALVDAGRFALLRGAVEVEVGVALLALRGLSCGAPGAVRNGAVVGALHRQSPGAALRRCVPLRPGELEG